MKSKKSGKTDLIKILVFKIDIKTMITIAENVKKSAL